MNIIKQETTKTNIVSYNLYDTSTGNIIGQYTQETMFKYEDNELTYFETQYK